MKRLLYMLFATFFLIPLLGQGSGVGYIFDLGASNFSHSSPHYDQYMRTSIHNGFIRFHDRSGMNALQILFGYRIDSVGFRNNSYYVDLDGNIANYNTQAYLKRNAWRLAAVSQTQFGNPGKFVIALNGGLIYEHSMRGKRYSYTDEIAYRLKEEFNPHNFGLLLGAEVRLWWFTIGCKYEKLIGDVLNHEYIINKDVQAGNSSELRGLKMNPGMGFIYLGVNLDFFTGE